jgi:hypothetical protein
MRAMRMARVARNSLRSTVLTSRIGRLSQRRQFCAFSDGADCSEQADHEDAAEGPAVVDRDLDFGEVVERAEAVEKICKDVSRCDCEKSVSTLEDRRRIGRLTRLRIRIRHTDTPRQTRRNRHQTPVPNRRQRSTAKQTGDDDEHVHDDGEEHGAPDDPLHAVAELESKERQADADLEESHGEAVDEDGEVGELHRAGHLRGLQEVSCLAVAIVYHGDGQGHGDEAGGLRVVSTGLFAQFGVSEDLPAIPR